MVVVMVVVPLPRHVRVSLLPRPAHLVLGFGSRLLAAVELGRVEGLRGMEWWLGSSRLSLGWLRDLVTRWPRTVGGGGENLPKVRDIVRHRSTTGPAHCSHRFQAGVICHTHTTQMPQCTTVATQKATVHN